MLECLSRAMSVLSNVMQKVQGEKLLWEGGWTYPLHDPMIAIISLVGVGLLTGLGLQGQMRPRIRALLGPPNCVFVLLYPGHGYLPRISVLPH